MQVLAQLVTPLAGGSIIVLALFIYVIYQCFFSSLAVFPGPLLAKLSKVWRAYQAYRGVWHREIAGLHRKHGGVVRIAPNELSIGDPAAFRTIYGVGGKFRKVECCGVSQGGRPFDLAGERNEKIHSEQRRMVSQTYTMDSMLHLEPMVDVSIKALLEKLDAECGRVIDFGYWLQLYAFDVIGSITFSRHFGYIHAGDDQGMFQIARETLKSSGWVMHVPWFFHIHQFLKPIIGNWLAMNNRNTFFFQFSLREVLGRRARGGHGKDIVGQLFDVQKIKPEMSDKNIASVATSNVMAGADTTSTALRSIIYLLLTHPSHLKRLLDEMVEREVQGNLDDPVTFQQVERWPYLQAVMYEALRLYAPVGSNLDREVPPGGMIIRDHFVPSGTVVGSSGWVIHRMPEVWGSDVEEFRPERWLDKSREGEYKRFFFAFGGGSRTCIGRNISWLEIGKLIPTLFRHYDMQLADDLDLKEDCGTLIFLTGLRVKLTRKQS